MLENNNDCNVDLNSMEDHIAFIDTLIVYENEKLNKVNQIIASLNIYNSDIYCKNQITLTENDSTHSFFSPFSSEGSICDQQNSDNISFYSNEIKTIQDKINHLNNLKEYIRTNFKIKAKSKNIDFNIKKHSEKKCNFLNLLQTQEDERNRIARDLHDSIVQNLTMLVHKAELCYKLSEMDIIRTKLELQNLISSTRISIDELRNIIYDLRPMSIDDLGLKITIDRFIKSITQFKDIQINMDININDNILMPIINVTIFRIIQEACYNSIKHSNAKNINIKVILNNEWLYLTITDDGCGFDINSIKKDVNHVNGYGLSMMRERVCLLSGEINIDSHDNVGTVIYVKIPVSMDGGKYENN